MKPPQFLSLIRDRALLAFVVTALAMQAIVPAGLMLVPESGQGARIILCPQAHPLARALTGTFATRAEAGMAALHAAMGHGAMDHAAMGHSGAPDDPEPAPSAAPASQSCAFAGAGALAALLPDRSAPALALLPASDLPPTMPAELRLAQPPRLRPPLRAPPVLI